MIHFFNPGHETAVLNQSPYYTAPANVVTMQRDLAFLPAWYAKEGDIVLVEDKGGDEFYTSLYHHLGFGVKAVTCDALSDYKNEEVALWGISPQIKYFFSRLNEEQELELRTPEWRDGYIYLNSRQAAADCLKILIDRNPHISLGLMPYFFTSLSKVETYVEQSPYLLLAKAPYSSSGRGLLWLPFRGLTRTEQQILHGILKKQGSVSVERVLNKQIDFAMEFMADGEGNIGFVGYSLFETNKKGAYTGNYIGLQKNIENRLSEKIDLSILENVKHDLEDILKEKYSSLYKGCIGVDMMIYLNDGGEYALHPCVEINMRSNMGLLALKIREKYVSEKSEGKFFLDFDAPEGVAYEKHLKMQKEYPPQFEDNKLMSGYLSLCPVSEKTHYRAYILIM